MNNKIGNGGPAFPFAATDGSNVLLQTNGMSLRDYFAGQALIGTTEWRPSWSADKARTQSIAEYAYAVADAMLAARKEKLP
jgi:hypothetical protein